MFSATVPREERHVLRQIADVLAERVALPARDVGAVEPHASRLRLPQAEHQPQQRGLARRARPDEAEALAGLEREGDPLDEGGRIGAGPNTTRST